ncbi:hypothetical protein VTI28DRAFT_9895 [Corynascus sepedonium]
MAQLVSDFIITPVLRQARRFSTGFAADEPPAIDVPAIRRRRAQSIGFPGFAGSAIAKTDEHRRLPTGDSVVSSLDDAVLPHQRRHEQGHAIGTLSQSSESLQISAAHPSVAHLTPESTAASRRVSDTSDTAHTDAQTQTAWPLPEGNRATPLPEDDGMGDLRRRIQAIQLLDVSQELRAQMMHGLLTEKYTRLQQSPKATHAAMRPVSRASTSTFDNQEPTEHTGPLQVLKKWNPLGDGSGPLNLPLTEEDLTPTFAPVKRLADNPEWWAAADQPEDEEKRLGCEHYRRNVKMQCASCERWYTCRHCHDAVEDHSLPRQQTKHMLCMLCGCAQKVSDTCTKCGRSAAYYYCGICKLWNDDASKPIYHCSDCGLCRVGQGLGKDFFHCKKCVACISMSETNHKCIERAVDSNCPICNEYLFDSPKSVTFMQCGHSIHLLCLEELKKTSYRCPLCNKSCVNMEYRFRQLDMQILHQPMPPEYADARAVISCNDCSAKSQTAYHWIGLKCAVCTSYNTTQLQLLNMPGGEHHDLPSEQPPVALDPALLAEEIRRRNRAARREQERQRSNQRRDSNNNGIPSFTLLSTSPSSYSRALLTRLLNRGSSAPSGTDQQVPEEGGKAASPGLLPSVATVVPASGSACSSEDEVDDDGEEEEDDDEDDGEMDMLDLFGAHNRDFDRMTGLTSAESAVGFDDDDDEEEEETSEDDDDDEDREEDEDEDDEDDILLLGHR